MYIPRAFRQHDRRAMHALVRSHPLAELVTVGTEGLLASTVPMHLRSDDGEDVLIGHVARTNPQRTHDTADAMVIFRGPDAYVSPSWYASKSEHGKVVPTWDYVVARAHGQLTVHDDATWVERTLTRMTEHHEADLPSPWSLDDAPAAFIATSLRAIVGIEIRVQRWDASWKLSQNRPRADIDGVLTNLRQGAHHQQHEVADLIEAHRPGNGPV